MEKQVSKRGRSSKDYSTILSKVLDEKDPSSCLVTFFSWTEKKIFRQLSSKFMSCVNNNLMSIVLNIPCLVKSVNDFWSNMGILQKTSLIIDGHNQPRVFDYHTFQVEKLQTVVFLDLEDTSVRDITNLDKCPNLEHLNISSTLVTNLDVVHKLLKLENLKANCLSLSTIEPLRSSKLKKLQLMDIDTLEDVSSLGSCSDLEYLSLDGSSCNSIFWNSEYLCLLWDSLINLNLSGTEVTDITSLRQAKNLKILKLDELKLRTLEPISSCLNLKELSLLNNTISDISYLENLQKLESLDIRGCDQLEDLSPLNNCISLVSLEIDEEYVSIFPNVFLN